MRRGTVVLIIFIIIVGGIIAASQFLQNQEPVTVTIAVDRLAVDWVREAVENFNATNPLVNGTQRIQISVIQVDDLGVWRRDPGWTFDDHPAGWIPSMSASIGYTSSNLPFKIIEPSLARTVLVWGGFTSRVNILTHQGETPLDWPLVGEAAATASWSALGGESSWQFINTAINWPTSSMAGAAVLVSAAGDFNATTTLSAADAGGSAFVDWYSPIYDSTRNAQRLGESPAAAMASRGTSVGDIGLLPESQWLLKLSDLNARETMSFSYPAYQVVMDFPLSVWDAPQADEVQRAAVAALGNWLTGAQAQSLAKSYGLRPVSGAPTANDRLFAAGQRNGILLQPDLSQAVTMPDRNILDGLIERFD